MCPALIPLVFCALDVCLEITHIVIFAAYPATHPTPVKAVRVWVEVKRPADARALPEFVYRLAAAVFQERLLRLPRVFFWV